MSNILNQSKSINQNQGQVSLCGGQENDRSLKFRLVENSCSIGYFSFEQIRVKNTHKYYIAFSYTKSDELPVKTLKVKAMTAHLADRGTNLDLWRSPARLK